MHNVKCTVWYIFCNTCTCIHTQYRQTEMETERQTETQTERERHTEMETDRDRLRQTDRDTVKRDR